MTNPTPEDRALFAQYQFAARQAAQLLVEACRENKPEGGAQVVQQIFDKNDIAFTMLVFGQLATFVVAAEIRAKDSHGPLVTPAEAGIDPDVTTMAQAAFITAIEDQMTTAVEAGDMPVAAQIAVDGHLRAFDVDARDGHTVDFHHLWKAMLQVNQNVLALEAAEMLRRLREGSG